MDDASERINRHPSDKLVQNVLRCPLDIDLSRGWRYPPYQQQGPDLEITRF